MHVPGAAVGAPEMDPGAVPRGSKLQILEAIIRLVSIDVVDVFMSSEGPSESHSHHEPMLGDESGFAPHRRRHMRVVQKSNMDVALDDLPPALPLRVASAEQAAPCRAEASTGGFAAMEGGSAGETGTGIRARAVIPRDIPPLTVGCLQVRHSTVVTRLRDAFAAAEFQAAFRALPRFVPPRHQGAAAQAEFGRCLARFLIHDSSLGNGPDAVGAAHP